MPILWPSKVPERGNAITQRKTLEIEHSCLFIHHTIWIYPFPHLILFNTPKKSLLKPSYPNQIFASKKNPGIENFKPKKILPSSPSLEIRRTPPPPGVRQPKVKTFPFNVPSRYQCDWLLLGVFTANEMICRKYENLSFDRKWIQ